MSLGLNRSRLFLKGLGTLEFLQVEPSVGSDFISAGYLQSMQLDDKFESSDEIDETGSVVNVLFGPRTVKFSPTMMQTSIDEYNFIDNAVGQVYVGRYSGLTSNNVFQFFCAERSRINPSINLKFDPKTPRVLPALFTALKRNDLTIDVPEYYKAESLAQILTSKLNLWIAPMWQYPGAGAVAYAWDISGWANHCTLSSAAPWTASTNPPAYLQLDGASLYGDCGNANDITQTGDFLVEAWIRIQAANGAAVTLLSKKAGTTNEAGYWLSRLAANTISLKLSDGTNSAVITSAATVLQNVWAHIAVAGTRNGNAQVYVNGVASGSTVAVSGVGNSATSTNLFLGRVASTYGQTDLGAVRFYNFGASGLPATIATSIANHFAGERSYFGV